MKKRSLEYEERFSKYLYSFDYDTHKEICEKIGINPKTAIEVMYENKDFTNQDKEYDLLELQKEIGQMLQELEDKKQK